MDLAGDQVSEPDGDPHLDDANDTEVVRFLSSLGRPRQLDSDQSLPLINLSCTKAYTYEDLLNSALKSVIIHPSSYMRTLVQLGYEPLPGVKWTFFGRSRIYLPGFFSYMRHIINADGWLGIYRGLRFSFAYTVSYEFVYKNAINLQAKMEVFESTLKDPEWQFENVSNFAVGLISEMTPRLVSLAVAYPFKVMTVRCMAQLVGRETKYDSFLESVLDLYQNGGLSAFYAGFVPYLLADCLVVYTRWIVFYLVHGKLNRSSRNLINAVTQYMASYTSYSLNVVSTIMSCNGPSARSLAASNCNPAFDHWIKCMQSLWSKGQQGRGYSLNWRSCLLYKKNDSQVD